jgi:hypothetical protein
VRSLLAVLGLLMALVAFDRVRQARPRAETHPTAAPARPPAAPGVRPAATAPTRAAAKALTTKSPAAAPPTEPESRTSFSDLLARMEVRRRLEAATGGTYFDSLFAQTDSAVRRWPDQEGSTLMVAVPPDSQATRTARMSAAMDAAIAAWGEVLPGFRISRTTDPAQAMVVVLATDTLGQNRAGQTDLQWDVGGSIKSAIITLAFKTPDGRPVSDPMLRAVALHELGHALGLGHSPDAGDVMFSSTRTNVLSRRDRATMSLLYELPLGPVKIPVQK